MNKYLEKIAREDHMLRGVLGPYFQEAAIARDYGKEPRSFNEVTKDSTRSPREAAHVLGSQVTAAAQGGILGAATGTLLKARHGAGGMHTGAAVGGFLGAFVGGGAKSMQLAYRDVRRHASKAHEKYAADSKYDKAVAATGAGLATAATVAHEGATGNLTGRMTVFHGTAKDYAKAIREEGLHPRKSKGVIDVLKEHANVDLNSEGLSFTSKDKTQAQYYANQAEHIKNHGPSGLMHNQLLGTFKGTGETVKFNVPTWRPEHTIVENPEIASYTARNPGRTRKQMSPQLDSFKHDVVFKGGLGTEHIPGHANYQKNSLKEVAQYVKANPGRFAKSVGKIGGIGALAGGALLAGQRAKHYLDKQSAFQSPDQVRQRLQPLGPLNVQWDGTKTIDPNARLLGKADAAAELRGNRLGQAKSLLLKKRIGRVAKTGLLAGAVYAAPTMFRALSNNS